MADLNGQAGSPTAKPRRLLALDGGGIRGVMSLEILRKMEQDLAAATGKGASFRLGDFFDYIGGTSTGAIIAAGLAMGKSVQELIDFYIDAGPLMFEKSSLIGRLRSFYQADPLRNKLNSVFGERTLGRRPAFAAVGRHAKCNDGFAVARLQQSLCPVQRSHAQRLQSADSAVAAGAGEHRRTRLFPA